MLQDIVWFVKDVGNFSRIKAMVYSLVGLLRGSGHVMLKPIEELYTFVVDMDVVGVIAKTTELKRNIRWNKMVCLPGAHRDVTMWSF